MIRLGACEHAPYDRRSNPQVLLARIACPREIAIKLRRGQFSFPPDLSDQDNRVHAQYAIDNGWAVSVEVNERRKEHGGKYVRVIAFDASLGWQSIRMSFIVNLSGTETGSGLSGRKAKAVSSSIPSRAMQPRTRRAACA